MTVEALERKIEQLEEDLQEEAQYHTTLERIVDRLADLGLIDNNPHSKMLYVEGKREL